MAIKNPGFSHGSIGRQPKADSPYAGMARRLLMEVEELTEARRCYFQPSYCDAAD